MRKEKVSVYLDPEIARALKEYAAAGGKPLSLVAEAAISSYTSPDAAERQAGQGATPRVRRCAKRIGDKCKPFCGHRKRSVHEPHGS